jgi:hypothetical protein
MTSSATLTLLPGARRLLNLHASELPQRDDLCGAFCGSLALHAAGLNDHGDGPLDQDTVAAAAGSMISPVRDAGTLPHGETGRRDYRLELPSIADSKLSGTTATGVLEAVASLSEQALEAIPLSGPWSGQTLDGLFELCETLERPVTLIANLATHHLWGARASASQFLSYLYDGKLDGPQPDWKVGHFVCVVGRMQGPGGTLYMVADTYPALGDRGVHMQPRERLAAALERRDMPAGGMLVVVFAEDAAAIRAGAQALGLQEGIWDNGTVTEIP